MSTAAQIRPGRGSRKSSVIDYVALAGVQSLGDEGIAHILAQVRQDGGTIDDLYSSTTKRLQDHYGLRSAVLPHLSQNVGDSFISKALNAGQGDVVNH